MNKEFTITVEGPSKLQTLKRKIGYDSEELDNKAKKSAGKRTVQTMEVAKEVESAKNCIQNMDIDKDVEL
jgi:hypothetical protein